MKKLWNLVSIIAVVNLLAVLGFFGWLASSGRMNAEKLRELLAPPPPPTPAEAPAAAGEAEPPADLVPTSVKIDGNDRQMRREAISLRRLQEEKAQLDKVLDQREAKLTSDTESLRSEQAAWESSIAELKNAKTDEQFTKAVKLLESVPAKQGKDLILELVSSGRKAEAVAYLDTMSAFKRSSLLKAFKGDEEMKVATDLLEAIRLRTPAAKPAAAAGPATPAAMPAKASPPNATAPAKPDVKPSAKDDGKSDPKAGAEPAATPAKNAGPGRESGAPAGPAPGKGAEGKPEGKPAGKPADGKPVANTGAEIDPPGERDGKQPAKPSGSGSGGKGAKGEEPDKQPSGTKSPA